MPLFWREEIRRKELETLKRQLRNKLGGYRVAIGSVLAGNTFYRGVVCEERPDKIERISYPPSGVIKKMGRLNRVGQSMFYASCGAPAVYYEIHAKAGDRVAVSTWELTELAWIHNLGFHPAALERIGGRLEGPRIRFSNPIPNESVSNAKLRRQLSEAFTEDVPVGEEWRYKLPIAINELLFDKSEPMVCGYPDGPKFDRAIGTAYPALGMRGAADNVAILPEYVERFLRLMFVSYILVEAVDAENRSFTVLSLAQADEFEGNKIIWRPGISDERARRGRIAFEDGYWVLRDGLGDVFRVR